jgi:transcriptional regulator with XRE-family HTH domain
MDNLMQIVGGRIRDLRKEKGWSQEELAHASGLHTTYIGKLERSQHQATLESLAKVTRALGITLEEFFHFIEPVEDGRFNDTVTQIVNSLQHRSVEDQRKALKLLEFVFDWKDH